MAIITVGSTILVLLFCFLLLGLVASNPLLRKGAKAHSRGASRPNAWWEAESNVFDQSLIINANHTIYRKMYIHNHSNEDITYTIKPKFWNEATSDDASVDVSLVFPGNVLVGAGTERTVSIVFQIHNDFMSRDASLLGDHDGYLEIDGGKDSLVQHLPWHFVSPTMDRLEVAKGILFNETTNVK